MGSSAVRTAERISVVTIAGVVLSYWVTSISLVFLNKYLLSSAELQLKAPLAITWFQCAVSFVCCYAVCKYGSAALHAGGVENFNFSLRTAAQIVPLSLIFVAMVAANNLCLTYVPVSFYYIARSTTVIFNVIFSYYLLGEKSSIRVIICCLGIIFGFLIGIKDSVGDSGELTLAGVLLGVFSTIFVALNAIYTKKLLPVAHNSSWQLSLYNNANALLMFVPFILLNGEMSNLYKFRYFHLPKFWISLVVSGVFGFLIGYLTVLQVKVTSPLTHNVSATAKSALQTVIAMLVFHESKEALFFVGNVVVLSSSLAYSIEKHKEMTSVPMENKPAV